MGSKLSINAATVASPPPTPSPPDRQSKDDQPSGLLTTNSNTPLLLRNPGTIEEMNKSCKELFPANFEGCRMVFNKGLSNYFQVSHTINMINTSPAGYRFGVTYVGPNLVGPGEAYPIFLGDIDPSGNLNSNIIHQFKDYPRIRSKFVTSFQDNKCVAGQFTTDYRGDTYTASCTLANIDIVNKSGIIIGHYLKNLTPKYDLGCELASQFSNQIPGGYASSIGLVGRYTSEDKNSTLCASIQPATINLHYYKKIHENFKAGVELETNLAMGESSASFGYQIDLPKADLTFKGSLDTNWQVGAVLEKKLQPLPFTLALSGAIDHSAKQNYKFGVGIVIG